MSLARSLRSQKFLLMALDTLSLGIALFLAFFLRHPDIMIKRSLLREYAFFFPSIILIWLPVLWYFGLYSGKLFKVDELFNIIKACLLSLLFLLGVAFFYRSMSFSRIIFALFLLLSIILIKLNREFFGFFKKTLFTRHLWQKNVLIVGHNKMARQLADAISRYNLDYRVSGYLQADGPQEDNMQGAYNRLGESAGLIALLNGNGIDEIYFVGTVPKGEAMRRIIEACLEHNVKWRFIPDFFKLFFYNSEVSTIEGIPYVGVKGSNLTGFGLFVKRILDIVLAVALLLLLAPLMLLIAFAIKAMSKGPVFFKQKRIGYKMRPFTFLKFRSMHVNQKDDAHRELVKEWAAAEKGEKKLYKLTKDPRIIPLVGRFIRTFSLDELPQLLNVIKGDMSLVGPRPCIPYELEHYRSWHKMRFDILPGITGLWQVSGRNLLTFAEMVELDISYLENWSLFLDIKIMLKTPFVMLFQQAH